MRVLTGIIYGLATGTLDDDNARTISNMGCIVSSYRVDASFGATISTVSHVCESDDGFLVYANVREAADGLAGHPPYSYSWSIGGCGNSITPIGGGAVASVQSSCSGGGTVHVNLTVTSSDGQTASAFQPVTVYVEPCSNYGGGKGVKRNYTANTQLDEKTQLRIYPNPTKDIFIVEYKNQQIIDEIEVIDRKGAILLSRKNLQNNSVEVNLSTFKSGIYYIKIFQNGSINYQKVVKIGS